MTTLLSKLESDFQATSISIDTRTLKKGAAYIALKGDHLDGHDFIPAAFAAGASCAIIREGVTSATGPLIHVADTMAALEQLGQEGRARTKAKIIGVTGSAGKTGTKEMLRIACAALGPTHASQKSFNNHWGVPLTLANLPIEAQYGVIEMGMNHAGELEKLSRLVQPDLAIITTIEPAHIEHFKSVEAIADAKAEIFSSMTAGGAAVLNIDNPHFTRLRAAALKRGLKVLAFGEDDAADARLADLTLHADSSRITADILGARVKYKINIPGKHIALNSLAVLTAIKALDGNLDMAIEALKNAAPVEGRGARKLIVLKSDTPPLMLIDDSYNANPASMAAALHVLEMAEPAPGGRRIAVLGDMLELGAEGPRLHAALANPLLKSRADLVFCCGAQMDALYNLLPEPWKGGHTSDSRALAPLVAAAVHPGDVVLIKGSAGSRMAYVVEALQALNLTSLQESRHAV